MKYFFFVKIFLILTSLTVYSENKNPNLLDIVCILKNKSSNEAKKQFSKTFNLKSKSLVKQIGIYYDKVLTFSENEIILTNNVYDSYSVFDLNSFIWTAYYNKRINVYECQ